MPRNYHRKTTRQQWSEEELALAVSAVTQGDAVNEASVKYGIPRTTLRRNLTAKEPVKQKLGPKPPVFTAEQEAELVNHLLDLESRFYGLTPKDVRVLAFELAERNNLKHPFSQAKRAAGRDWLEGFLKRNSSVSFRKPEPTSVARARGFNKIAVGTFYKLLKEVQTKYKFKPSQMNNADETPINTVSF